MRNLVDVHFFFHVTVYSVSVRKDIPSAMFYLLRLQRSFQLYYSLFLLFNGND